MTGQTADLERSDSLLTAPPLTVAPPADTVALTSTKPTPSVAKQALRQSLRASTFDGMFATVFSNVTTGVLLSNFLVELGATPSQIGLLAAIPMLANLIQPLGAILGDRTTSRHHYCLWIYGPSRLLWLILLGGIGLASQGQIDHPTLVYWTLAIAFLSHLVGALGSAPWFSWLATLVPRRLRGRYFGTRNSAASLVNLLSIPALGWLVSSWVGGSLQGYGLTLLLAVFAGLTSLGFQFWMVDVNPQRQCIQAVPSPPSADDGDAQPALSEARVGSPQVVWALLQDKNFLLFLLYFGVWMFAVNLSGPFFNLYMLDNLAIDIRWVTLYNSLTAGANLLLLLFWGKLADRIGNRALLILVGLVVAITPLLWIGTGTNALSLLVWLPLLHVLTGGTWAAIDLCTNNLQIGVASVRHQATYFAIAAAVAGVSGALGTTAGGFLAELADYGGLPGLFALSAAVRLMALLPLVFVKEHRGPSLRQMMRLLFPLRRPGAVLVSAAGPVGENGGTASLEAALVQPSDLSSAGAEVIPLERPD